MNLIDNTALNTNPNRQGNYGPGNLDTGGVIGFTTLAPYYTQAPEGRQEDAIRSFAWGWFDASTNAPAVFPDGTSVRDLERIIFSGGGGSSFNIAQ